jgi:hypothetical protein
MVKTRWTNEAANEILVLGEVGELLRNGPQTILTMKLLYSQM